MALVDTPTLSTTEPNEDGLYWTGRYTNGNPKKGEEPKPIFRNADGTKEWSGRRTKDGTPIMQKPREQFAEREPTEEDTFRNQALKLLKLIRIPDDDIKVRADAWGEGRTVFFRWRGEKAAASTMDELLDVLGLRNI